MGNFPIVFNQNLQDSLMYRYVNISIKRIQNFEKNIFHPKRENSIVYSPRNFENPIFLQK
ncbi:hypothetical protein T12_14620 [Trichinella patagoniensis]|uniref:Uncharacterized protein n=1 Tax=Trichinella patagoniensis TaxID=990121 RepID=A0A0V0Z4X4_9BILA|nr:hypothetical protein T12_14620 [Trichinella patagoniensis]